MISIIRRFTTSWIAGAILALITIAVLVTGIGTPSGLGNLAPQGDSLATIGKHKLGQTDVERHVGSQYEAAKRENPTLDLPSFIAGGGFDASYADYVTSRALEFFGLQQGMVASKLVLDRQIANIQAFHGPTGEFDEKTYEAAH
jgi:peptidyl-prolyl cis-trans isomerase D